MLMCVPFTELCSYLALFLGCDGASQNPHPSDVDASVGCGCGFVARSQLPAIMTTEIQLSYLKSNSYKQSSISSE